MPWRDLHVEWDFGDGSCVDRHATPVRGVAGPEYLDQRGSEAFHVYSSAGQLYGDGDGQGSHGRDQYTVASTTTLRANQYQMIFFPQATFGTFRLEWPVGSGNWTEPITPAQGSSSSSGPVGSPHA